MIPIDKSIDSPRVIQATTRTVPSQLNVIARGSSFAFLGRIIGVILQYGFNVGLGRLYGAGLIGIFAFGLSVLNVAAILGQLGTQETLLRFVAIYRGSRNADLLKGILLFGLAFGVGSATVLAGLVWANADLIGQWANKPDVAPIISRLAPAVPLLALIIMSAFALQGTKRLDKAALVYEIGIPFAGGLALATAVGFGLNFESFVSNYVISIALVAGFGLVLLWREFTELHTRSSTSFRGKEWLSFSVSITLMNLFQSTMSWTDTFLLGLLRPAEEVGVYYVALRTALLITIALAAVNAIFSPVAADLWQQGDVVQLTQLFKITTRWMTAFTLPVSVAMILTRRELMSMFGTGFEVGSVVLLIILLGRVINGITGGVARLLIMTGHHKVELVNTVIAVVVMTGGTLWVAPRYGMVGVAVVNSGVVAGMNLLKLLQVKLIIGIQPYEPNYLKIVAASLVSFLTGWYGYSLLAGQHPLIIIVLVSSTVIITFLTLLFVLKLPAEDRVILRRVITRLESVLKAPAG